MKSQEEVVATLERLGNAWPQNDSLVERVLHGLETAPPVVATKPARSRWVQRLAACATAVAAAIVVGWILRPNESLFAQARQAMRGARTLQMVVRVPAQGDQPAQVVQGLWYERGVGFREESPTLVTVGNALGTWRHVKDSPVAVLSRGNVIREMVDHVLNDDSIGRLLKDDKHMKYERYEAGDQDLEGQPCRAYLLTQLSPLSPELERELRDGKRRMVFLLDDRSRIARVVDEVRSGEEWTVKHRHDWKYDAPIDRTLFEPQFGDGVAVMDIDAAFEQFVGLNKAVHREERQGLIYAIHHVERFENGGIYLVSSVRGTDATLQKYPLKRERWGASGAIRVTGPATNYYGSQEYRVPGIDLELASMDHQGIHVSWRALIPLDTAAKEPFAAAPGKVRLPAGISPTGGEYGKANFLDDNGVMQNLTWDVVLDCPQPALLPTFDTIVGHVYTDVTALDAVHFKFLNMGHRGFRAVFISDLRKISPEDHLAAVTDDVRWWRAGCPQDDARVLELKGKPAPAMK